MFGTISFNYYKIEEICEKRDSRMNDVKFVKENF